jgi:putative endonuclease
MFGFLKKVLRLTPAGGAGGEGERLAADWLRHQRRFEVITQNWRNPHDRREEIDLVCRDGEALVFVEVKARAASALVPGFFAVDARKKRVVRRAARSYLAQLRDRPRTVRFDVVEVAFPARAADGTLPPPEIMHFENVLLFGRHFLP